MASGKEELSVRTGGRPQNGEAPLGASRRLGSGHSARRQARDVDMTSMVDVTFLLLIFFMVTASFNLQKSIAVPPQRSDLPGNPIDDPQQTRITVQVDERGSFLVMTPGWEFEALGKQKLIATLKRAVTESSEGTSVHVQVHELARLEALVVVLDAAATVGLTDVQVTQVDYLSLSS